MLSQLKAISAFVNASKAALDPAAVERLRAQQTSHLANLFRNSAPDAEVAAVVVRLLTGESDDAADIMDAFTADQRKMLATALADRMSAGSVSSGPTSTPKASVQTHVSMHQYLTRNDWSTLMDTSTTSQDKLHTVINRSLQIGLCNPSELSTVSIIAVITTAARVSLSAEENHELLKEYKRINKLRRVGAKQTLVSFSSSISDFLSVHGDRYDADDQPIPCPINLEEIEKKRLSIAARRTHKTLQATSDKSFHMPAGGSMMHCMQQCMSVMMDQMSNKRKEPSIQFLQPRRESHARHEQTPLALPGPMSGSVPIAQAAATTPRARADFPAIADASDEDEADGVVSPRARAQPMTPAGEGDADDLERLVADMKSALKAKAATAADAKAAAEAAGGGPKKGKAKAKGKGKSLGPKAKAKGKGKGGAKPAAEAAKTTPSPKTKPSPKAKGMASPRAGGKPTVDVEWSRCQVMARTGLKGSGQSKSFRFTGYNHATAKKQARAWLAESGF